MANKRNTCISICKALAIILMCMGHTEGPSRIINFIYLFHMPVFFITAGYFFSRKYVDNPWNFCVKRFKGLYLPFVKWALFFLIAHNAFFAIGILNERYGNWEGGVTHPYSLHTFMQRLFDIIFSMGGYDEFLAGAFWFFRALLVSSIVFLALFLLLRNRRLWLGTTATCLCICALALIVAFVKIQFQLRIPTVMQGGIRECWGVFFFSVGVLYRKHEQAIPENAVLSVICFLLLAAGSALHFHGMTLSPKPYDVLTLPFTGIIGFLMLHHISAVIDRHKGCIKRFLVYCGDNTLYIFVFHIIAFKLVTVAKIIYYGLDWEQIGTHMVVHYRSQTDLFFILYTIVGTAVPLLWIFCYRKAKSQISRRFSPKQA